MHFAFLAALSAAIILFAWRHDQLHAGIFASLLFFLSPAVALNGTTAYADVALAAAVFGAFWAVELWKETGSQRLLILAGTLAGFSFTIKYTGLLAVIYVLAAAPLHTRRLRTVMPAAIPAMLLTSLYIGRNWLILGNPVSPFLNSWFPNPHVHVAFETMVREMMHRYPGLASYWQLPWETAVRGVVLQGFLGPVFLILPVALFALRTSLGRTLLIAGAVFALPVIGNIGTRFWMPSLPFFALALGLVVTKRPVIAGCIVALHAITALPPVARLYAAPGAPMLSGLPIRAALRFDPEEQALQKSADSYDVVRIIERHVPANATVNENRLALGLGNVSLPGDRGDGRRGAALPGARPRHRAGPDGRVRSAGGPARSLGRDACRGRTSRRSDGQSGGREAARLRDYLPEEARLVVRRSARGAAAGRIAAAGHVRQPSGGRAPPAPQPVGADSSADNANPAAKGYDPALVIPADGAARVAAIAALERFCDVFPAAFLVSERTSTWLARNQTGRLLSAGFHSAPGISATIVRFTT